MGSVKLHRGIKKKIIFKNCRDFIKCVVTLAKIQRLREASHHLTLMVNCRTFYLHLFVFV